MSDEEVLVDDEGDVMSADPIPRRMQWMHPRTKQAKMVLLSIIVVSVVGLGLGAKISYETPGAAISGCSNDTDLAGWDQVKFLKLTDSDKTLTIDDWPGSGASYETIACALRGLDVPMPVQGQIDNTSSLSGIQTASWKPNGWWFHKVTATWTSHPDDGLDMVIISR